MCMYVVFCKIDHCIHIHWCIVMGLGHNDPWVESHMWPQQTWGQRLSRGQWPLVQVFGKKGQCIHILWCIFKSNITMIAKVCDRESRRDTWFENRLVNFINIKTAMCNLFINRIGRNTHTNNCAPTQANEALWGRYQNWHFKFNILFNIQGTFWHQNDFHITFLSKVLDNLISNCLNTLKIDY